MKRKLKKFHSRRCKSCHRKGHNVQTCRKRNPAKKWTCSDCNKSILGGDLKPKTWIFYTDNNLICDQCTPKYVNNETGFVDPVENFRNLDTPSDEEIIPGNETKVIQESFHDAGTKITPAPMPESAPRQAHFGHFKILCSLGQGGMGAVYKVYDEKLKRIVALKTLLMNDSPELLKRFKREAQATARLRHPNIINIYEIGEIKDQAYLVMDFIDGTTLEDRLRGKNKLSLKKSLEVMVKIVRAVDYAHKNKIIHRDLKPQNIMLDKDDNPLILDFGLAKIIDAESKLTKTGTVMGSLAYMSPEQVGGEKLDYRSDIFALGAILYNVIVGRPPFHGSTRQEIAQSIVTRDPILPSQFNRRITPDLDTICLKALEKEKEKRYQTAGDLADDLEKFLKGKAIKAKPLGVFQRGRKFIRKHKAGTAILSILGASGLGGGILVEKSRREQAKMELVQDDLRKEQALLEKARFEYDSGNFKEALRLYNQSLELNPNSVRALYGRANIKYVSEDYDAALIDLNQVLTLNPNHESALDARSSIYTIQNKFDLALLDCNRVVSLNSENFSYRSGRGWVLFNMGKIKESLKDYKKALELLPTKAEKVDPKGVADFLGRYAHVCFADDDFEDAFKFSRKALQLNPETDIWLLSAVLKAYHRDDVSGGIRDLEKFIEILPNSPRVVDAQEELETLKKKIKKKKY